MCECVDGGCYLLAFILGEVKDVKERFVIQVFNVPLCPAMQAHRIFIGMGSNVPEAFDLLRTAVLRLSEMAEGDVVVSTPERTEPIDFPRIFFAKITVSNCT